MKEIEKDENAKQMYRQVASTRSNQGTGVEGSDAIEFIVGKVKAKMEEKNMPISIADKGDRLKTKSTSGGAEGEVITYQEGDGEKYRNNKTVKKVIIGAGVTKIAEEAFWGCSNLAEVDLGSCKELGQGAFAGTALREVFIPKSTEKIGRPVTYDAGVFHSCSNLQKVVFEGNNVKIIGANAFQGIAAETIELKEGVTTIGKGAFESCSNLSTLVWPTSITTVEGGVFNNCTQLHELTGSDNQDDVITYLKKPQANEVKKENPGDDKTKLAGSGGGDVMKVKTKGKVRRMSTFYNESLS